MSDRCIAARSGRRPMSVNIAASARVPSAPARSRDGGLSYCWRFACLAAIFSPSDGADLRDRRVDLRHHPDLDVARTFGGRLQDGVRDAMRVDLRRRQFRLLFQRCAVTPQMRQRDERAATGASSGIGVRRGVSASVASPRAHIENEASTRATTTTRHGAGLRAACVRALRSPRSCIGASQARTLPRHARNSAPQARSDSTARWQFGTPGACAPSCLDR
jgi:hypothetical protein